MQSVSKTVTSVTIGIARTRDDFTASLDTPIVKFFDSHKIANLDARKKRITIRDLLTMTAGLEWHEDLPYDDPKNSADIMEASHDWAQYAIDQPMAEEPGKVFVYNSGATVLLAHIFKKVTGKNIDDYAEEHLFKPLGMHYFWKHSPTGLPDTEGGLYLSPHDLAKIGQLYLKGGMWEGKEIVSSFWIKESVAPHVDGPRQRLEIRLSLVAAVFWQHARRRSVDRARVWRTTIDCRAGVRHGRRLHRLGHLAINRETPARPACTFAGLRKPILRLYGITAIAACAFTAPRDGGR